MPYVRVFKSRLIEPCNNALLNTNKYYGKGNYKIEKHFVYLRVRFISNLILIQQ